MLRDSGGQIVPTILLASLLVTLLALALPIALLQVYDRILPNAAISTLVLMASAVAVAILLETALRMARGAILGRIAASAETRAHRAAVARILGTSSSQFEAHGNGYYSERLTAIGSLREAWSGPALQAMLICPSRCSTWWPSGSLPGRS
jgi:ATP-binding cassette subfamily C protein LapB